MSPAVGRQTGSDEHAALLVNGLSPGASSAALGRDADADRDAELLLRPHVVISEDTDGGSESLPADWFSWRKLWAFTGPGFLMSIAYIVRVTRALPSQLRCHICGLCPGLMMSVVLCAGPG